MAIIQIIMRKYPPFFLMFGMLIGPLMGTVQTARAEVECGSEVSYTWTQERDASVGEGASPVAAATAVKATPTSVSATPQASEPGGGGPGGNGTGGVGSGSPTPPSGQKTVRFFIVQRKGSNEAAARTLVDAEVQRQKLRAADRCKRAHESLGECLTTKLSIKSSTLNSLSFSARSQAEKAIMDECQLEQGRCLSVDSTAPNCRDLAAPAVEASGKDGGAPAADESSKGKPAGKGDSKAKEAKGKDAKKK